MNRRQGMRGKGVREKEKFIGKDRQSGVSEGVADG